MVGGCDVWPETGVVRFHFHPSIGKKKVSGGWRSPTPDREWRETRAGAVEADQSLNCHRPSGTGESRSKFSVLFFVLLSSFMCGAWPLSEQNGFWSVTFQFS